MTEPLTEPIKHYLTCHAQDPFHFEGDGCWNDCAEAIEALDARAPLDVERRDLLDIAWTIIANAGGGDWTLEAKDWQEAAAAWRERYHAALAAEGSGE